MLSTFPPTSWSRGLTAVGLALALGLVVFGTIGLPEAAPTTSNPRLIMVKIDRAQTAFFNLPEEVPVLLSDQEEPAAYLRHYDFDQGMKAMMVFLSLRPQDSCAPGYRRFLKKWPLYQEFFKAVKAKAYPKARQLLGKIQRIDPDEAAAKFYEGSLHAQTGDFKAAEAAYQTSVERFAGYGPAYVNLARLARRRKDPAQARVYLETGIQEALPSGQEDVLESMRKMLASLQPQQK